VADEHARGAAVAHVPQAHGAVVGAGGQQVAVGVPPHDRGVAVVPCAAARKPGVVTPQHERC